MSDHGAHSPLRGKVTGAGGFVVLFCAAATLCIVRGAWELPLLSDNQHYFFIAERAAAGVPPHVSQFDPKHALSGFMSALAIKGGRVLGLSDAQSARVLSIAVTSAAVGIAWLLTLKLTSDLLAAALAAIMVMSVNGFVLMGAMGCRPKVFLALFVLLTLHAFVCGRYKQAGLFAAGSFLCWQPGLLMVACAVPALAVTADGRRALPGFLLSAVAVVGAYHGYFFFKGVLATQLEQAYLLPAAYSSYGLPDPWRALRWVLKLRGGFGVSSIAPTLFVGGLLSAWIWFLAGPRRGFELLRSRPSWLYLLLCAHAVFAFTLVEHQGPPDFFFLLPFVAVGAAVTIWALGRVVSAGLPSWVAQAVTAVMLVLFVSVVGDTASKPFKVRFTLEEQQRLGASLAPLLAEGASVYAVGCTHLLAFNHVDNHVHYGYFFRRINRYVVRHSDGPFRPLKDGRAPDYIVKSRWFFPRGLPWLKREYRRIALAGGRRQHVSLWRRVEG